MSSMASSFHPPVQTTDYSNSDHVILTMWNSHTSQLTLASLHGYIAELWPTIAHMITAGGCG